MLGKCQLFLMYGNVPTNFIILNWWTSCSKIFYFINGPCINMLEVHLWTHVQWFSKYTFYQIELLGLMISPFKLFTLIPKLPFRSLAPGRAEVLISVYKSARFSTPSLTLDVSFCQTGQGKIFLLLKFAFLWSVKKKRLQLKNMFNHLCSFCFFNELLDYILQGLTDFFFVGIDCPTCSWN